MSNLEAMLRRAATSATPSELPGHRWLGHCYARLHLDALVALWTDVRNNTVNEPKGWMM